MTALRSPRTRRRFVWRRRRRSRHHRRRLRRDGRRPPATVRRPTPPPGRATIDRRHASAPRERREEVAHGGDLRIASLRVPTSTPSTRSSATRPTRGRSCAHRPPAQSRSRGTPRASAPTPRSSPTSPSHGTSRRRQDVHVPPPRRDHVLRILDPGDHRRGLRLRDQAVLRPEQAGRRHQLLRSRLLRLRGLLRRLRRGAGRRSASDGIHRQPRDRRRVRRPTTRPSC